MFVFWNCLVTDFFNFSVMLCPNTLGRGFISSYFFIGRVPVSSLNPLFCSRWSQHKCEGLSDFILPRQSFQTYIVLKPDTAPLYLYWEKLCKTARYVSTGKSAAFFTSDAKHSDISWNTVCAIWKSCLMPTAQGIRSWVKRNQYKHDVYDGSKSFKTKILNQWKTLIFQAKMVLSFWYQLP